MEEHLYHYRANVTGVYDGDTCTVDIDLGLHIWARSEKIRLHGINAPELRGEERPAGLKSRDFLRSVILNQSILLETIKDRSGKYGRYLGIIWLSRDGKWINVNDLLVEKGFAVAKEY